MKSINRNTTQEEMVAWHFKWSACCRCILAGVLLIGMVGATHVASAKPLVLAEDGVTTYSITVAADASPVDRYAAEELRAYLGAITDAEFPIVVEGESDVSGPVISVGDTALARQRFGADYRAVLKRRDHVMRSDGADIFLYGNGVHGSLQAVIGFLERELGWRWYTVFEHPVTPKQRTAYLEPFHHEHDFSFFRIEGDIQRNMDFAYQLGMNLGLTKRAGMLRTVDVNQPNLDAYVSYIFEPIGAKVHIQYEYLPPQPEHPFLQMRGFEWIEKRNYFETNPEFFAINERTGQRTHHNSQLDFSNPEMRAELTRNILRHLEILGEDEVLLTFDAEDTPGRFCACEGCLALEEKYQSPGGPIYDYLIELCGVLAEKHPGVKVLTLAYRRAQTQKPPVLPEGQRLPDNLIIDFAPIEDSFFADWDSPDEKIRETYSDLKAWGRLTDNLWAWLYPVGFGTGYFLPVDDVTRMVVNMRKLKEAGVDGIFWDTAGMHSRAGFGDLVTYIGYKLAQDVDQDADALIKEATDHFYGPAAPLMRQYIAELRDARLAMDPLPPSVTHYAARFDNVSYPYLTVENIHRWQGYFDQMIDVIGREGDDRQLLNVMLVWRNLDFATLSRWFDLQDAYPEYYIDYTAVVDRIKNATNVSRADGGDPRFIVNRTDYEVARERRINRSPRLFAERHLQDFAVRLRAGREVKPLPEGVEYADADFVRQFVPAYPNTRKGTAVVLDADAAFGFATPVHYPDLPFTAGFYQNDTKKHGKRISISRDQIVPNTYQLFEIGEVEITPNSIIWTSSRSWETQIQLGEQLYEAGSENRWRAYISVKFAGPTYGGDPEENLVPIDDRKPYGSLDPADLVLVDRVILVPLSKSQFE